MKLSNVFDDDRQQILEIALFMSMTPNQLNENVGGGRVYGEYNKGPYKAGAEYNWDEAARHSQHMHHHRHI